MNINKLPLRQKSFVLGAATIAAAGAGGAADAQSVSYNASSIGTATVSGNPGTTGGNDSTTNAAETSLSPSVAVALQAFNPATFASSSPNPGATLAELTGVTLTMTGQVSFNQSGSWSVNATAVAYTFVVSIAPGSATLQLTNPSFSTLNAATPSGTASSSTSGITGTKGNQGNLNCAFTSNAGSNTESFSNGSFAAGVNFATPNNIFYGSGNIASLNLDLQDNTVGEMANITIGGPRQVVTNYFANSTGLSIKVTYGYQFVPAPDALSLFLPGMTGVLVMARRRRRALKRAA